MTPTAVDYADQVARKVIMDMLVIIDGQEKEQGDEFAQRLMIQILARYVGTIVYGTLRDRPADLTSKKLIEEYVIKNFTAVKAKIQDAVSAGFEGAMTTYSGTHMEYYCKIQNVGVPINKHPI